MSARRAGVGAVIERPLPSPFELRLALFGHGWIDLAPHRWTAETGTWQTALAVGPRAFDLTVTRAAAGLRVEARGPGRASAAERRALAAAVDRALRLDEDFAPFWAACAATPRLRWAAERGAGRMLRSPSVFEDLSRILFTTNCTWAVTRKLSRTLIEALGPETPSGARAFPDAATVAAQPVAWLRDELRAGYRSESLKALAEDFAAGRLTEAELTDPERPTAELRQRLLGLRGFGPYAVGQALRLLGRYDDFALDSWCRARLLRITRRRTPPTEASLARRYRRFGAWRGLAMWVELTAEWHGEGVGPSSPSPLTIAP